MDEFIENNINKYYLTYYKDTYPNITTIIDNKVFDTYDKVLSYYRYLIDICPIINDKYDITISTVDKKYGYYGLLVLHSNRIKNI